MEQENRPFTFVQFSDVHLDSPQNRGVLSYSPAKCQERYADFVETFVFALSFAKENNVDAVFIPGGLWNRDTIRSQTAGTVLEAIEQISPIPVYISPSDNDPYSIDSPYSSKFLSALGMRAWPENAIIFNTASFKTLIHPTRKDVTITGRAYKKFGVDQTRYLTEPINISERSMVNILLHHGSLELEESEEFRQQLRAKTCPFNIEELDNQRFTYVALGHNQDYLEVENREGLLIGAYSGCLVGRNFEELGPRGLIHGSISTDEEGGTIVDLAPTEAAKNRIMYIAVDITGLDEELIKEEILLMIEENDINPETDIVALSLEGRFAHDNTKLVLIDEIKDEFYHLIVVDRTRPDYLSEQYDPRTTEYKFIERMLESIQEAEAKREASPPGDSLTGLPGALISGKTIEDALYYGLDALKNKKVTVRHVD